MPTPNRGEGHDAFIERCIPIVIDDGTADNPSQARAICESLWDNRGTRTQGSAMYVKTFDRGQIKQIDEAGHGVAVIATLNTIDKDGDVTLPGAFGNQVAQMVPAHNWGHVPLGKGTIREEGDQVLADFRMNLDAPSAREWHAALKFDMENGPALQEWSYGFTIKADGAEFGQFEGHNVQFLKDLDVHEFSPVLLGAGEGTRTLEIKSVGDGDGGKRAVPSHSTATSAQPWDGPANERLVRKSEGPSYYNRIYAWRDADGEPGNKSSWKFVHHFVDRDGEPGAASVRAAIMGIGVLNGARGGTTIPDDERSGVHRHLARHLRDADEDVPELRSYDECAVKLADQIRFACWDAEAAIERAKAVRDARKADGRDLAADRYDEIGDLRGAVDELYAVSRELDSALRRGGEPTKVADLLGEVEATRARIAGRI